MKERGRISLGQVCRDRSLLGFFFFFALFRLGLGVSSEVKHFRAGQPKPSHKAKPNPSYKATTSEVGLGQVNLTLATRFRSPGLWLGK